MTKFYFNKLILLQSLSDDDLKNGLNLPNINLINTVEVAISQNDNLHFFNYNLLTINLGVSQFENIIDSIIRECENNQVYPIIHFLGHGEKGKGIYVWDANKCNYDCIAWECLFNYLCKINKVCHNNLFFTTTACNGFDCFTKLFIEELDTIPIVGIVAIDPDELFYVSDANDVFCEFYRALLSTFSINEAINAVVALENKLIGKLPYIAFSDTWFIKAYKNIVDKQYSDDNLKKLIGKYRYPVAQRNKILSDYKAKIIKDKQADYVRIRNRKFMFDDPKVDRTRFDLPNTI